MRRLFLLVLAAIAALPLSAHGRWHRPRRTIIYGDAYYPRWDGDRCGREDWGRRHWRHRRPRYDRYACEEPPVYFRPLPPPPPIQGRLELWIR